MANHSRKKNLASAPQRSRLDCQHRHSCPGICHGKHHAKRETYEPPRPTPSTAPSPTEREQRADRGCGVVGVRKAESQSDNILNNKFHYTLVLLYASDSAISTDFALLLHPIYDPLFLHAPNRQ